ncbi:MAG: CMP-N-acetylneuraminic acid synthetase [Candidatus Endolissoclinum sp. TMED37]|nr:MAG: CMP-N-acetylneuraminic acid synthetase [Candidatus Endolissoclinum sp. TMED37]|tara:strand:- start:312 stop:1331 length:1020 start_codon:yes stop_codon:yes gene_type:complete
MTFNDYKIGKKHPIFIIAEGGDNHMGSLADAIEMCTQAKLAGASAIKFQHHLPDKEMLKDIPMSDNFEEPLYEFLKKNALTLDQHKKIFSHCKQIGIEYMCTPFSYQAAVELKEIGLGIFKIGSGELTDLYSLSKIAELGNPMIVSTGMSTYEEIDSTYKFLLDKNVELALTNCVSEYPPKYEDVNLGVILEMKKKFPNALIGHSDHTPDIYTCLASVIYSPVIIEKHVILDKRTPGPDQSVSIDFSELKMLCDGIRKIESAMGNVKLVHEREKQIRAWAHRSVVSVVPISEGTVITEKMLWTKRPGTGIPSADINNVIGKTAIVDIESDTLINYKQLS